MTTNAIVDYLDKLARASAEAQTPPFGLEPQLPGSDGPTFGFKKRELTDPERAWEAWNASKRGEEDNLAFVDAVTPIIDKALTLYAGGPDPVARSRARLLALKAAGSWDRKRANLQTHLLTQLQPLRRYAAARRYATRVPERAQWQLAKLKNVEAELRDELDRDPTELELADRVGLSVRRIGQLRRIGPQTATGAYLESEYQPVVEDAADAPDHWLDFVYHDLGAADRVIFEGRSGYNGKPRKSVEQLARELGISSGTVSKRAARIAELINSRPKGW